MMHAESESERDGQEVAEPKAPALQAGRQGQETVGQETSESPSAAPRLPSQDGGRAALRTYDTIYLDRSAGCTHGTDHCLAKSISDASWVWFRSILEAKAAKAAYARRQVVAVPAQYPPSTRPVH